MPEFFIHKQDGKFQNIKKLDDYNKSLPDGRYKVTVEKSDKRSSQQNRYYWGVVIHLINQAFYDLGHELTAEETHEFLKAKFNHKEIVNSDTGELLQLPLSTTRLNKSEFSEYVEKIQRFAAEFLNTVIPDPGEQLEIEVND